MEWLHYAPARTGSLRTADVAIVEWQSKWAEDFRRLNEEWIPQEVIARGGAIVVAVAEGEVVGTGALVSEGDGVYELAKMAVTPAWQGRGIGRMVAERLLRIARDRGATKVELEFRHVPVGSVTYQRADVRMELTDLNAAS